MGRLPIKFNQYSTLTYTFKKIIYIQIDKFYNKQLYMQMLIDENRPEIYKKYAKSH